jgi:L-asparagine transporter-like permease
MPKASPVPESPVVIFLVVLVAASSSSRRCLPSNTEVVRSFERDREIENKRERVSERMFDEIAEH